LTDLIPDGDIQAKVRDGAANLDSLAQALIEAANAAGGTDNITVGLCRVE
jgi:serine/threonine protein phosphatase PrpC